MKPENPYSKADGRYCNSASRRINDMGSAKLEWMPKNPYEGDIDIFNNIRLATKQGFDEGGEAYTKAMIKWLFEPCTEHPFGKWLESTYGWPQEYQLHRYKCEKCM